MARRATASNRIPAANDAPSIELSVLWTIAGFNLRMLDIQSMRTLGERLDALDLTPAAASTLLVIEANPEISHGALADALHIQRPNMTKLVSRLETTGVVCRETTPDDRRRTAFSLTPAGRRLSALVLEVLRDHDAFVLAALSPAERRTFLDLVAKVRSGLERRKNEAPLREAKRLFKKQ